MVVLVLLASRLCAENENALEAVAERAAGKHHALYKAGVLPQEEEEIHNLLYRIDIVIGFKALDVTTIMMGQKERFDTSTTTATIMYSIIYEYEYKYENK